MKAVSTYHTCKQPPLRPIAQTNYANATQQGTVGNDQLSHMPSRKLPEEGLELYLEKIEKEILMNALNLTHWNRTLRLKSSVCLSVLYVIA